MGMARRRRRSLRIGPDARGASRYFVEPLERRVLLSTVFWTGQGSTPSWSDPHNWSTGALPGPSDDAVISVAGAVTTITFDTASTAQPTQTVNSLSTNQPINFVSGTFTATNGVQTSANLFLAGATLFKTTLNGTGNLYMSTGTLDADTLNLVSFDSVDTTGVQAPVAVDGGLTLNATLNVGIPGSGEIFPSSGTLDFFGTQSVSGKGQIVLQQFSGTKAQIVIRATILFIRPIIRYIPATLTLAPSVILRGTGTVSDSPNGYGTLVNQGVIVADVQGQTLQISPENFNDQGTATQINGGILSILAGADGKGALTFSRNATVNNIPSIGTLTITAGDVSINSSAPVTVGTLNLSGGVLDGTAEIDLTGANSSWTGGTMAGTGTFIVEPGAVLNVNASPSVSASRPFNNNGTINLNAGILELDGLGVHNGAFAIATGATLVLGGKVPQTFTATSSLTGGGAVIFQSGGGAAIRGTYNLFSTTLNAGSLLEFLGPLAVTRFLTVAGGSKVFVGPPQLTATGAALAAAPALSSDPILQVITQNVIAGTMEVVPFCTLEEDGVLLFTGAAGPAVLLDSDVTTPGTLKLQNGDTVQFAIGSGNASITSQGVAALPGQVSIQGGSATFSVNGGLRIVVSAPIAGGAIDQEQGTGVLQVSGKQALAAITVGSGTLDVDAAPSLGANVPIVFAGGTLQVRDQPSLTVGSLMTSVAGNAISLDLGTAALTADLGLSAASTLFVSGTGAGAKLIVSGTIALQQPAAIHDDTADVEFAAPLTLAGATPLSGYAMAKAGAGTLTLDGGVTNTPAGLVEVDGGTLVLNKPGGTALDANVLINGPTSGTSVVRLAQDNQIDSGHGVTLDATTGPALLDLSGHAQTLASLAIANAAAMPPNPQNDLLFVGSGHLTLAMPSGVMASIGTLSVGAGGRIDLGKGSLAILYGAPALDPAAPIRGMLASGAMFSSAADSIHTLGFGDWADHTVSGLTANSLLIKYTPIGDVDLDGHVGFNDLVILARHYGSHNANWDQGDITYDGIVGFADLVALARNYGK